MASLPLYAPGRRMNTEGGVRGRRCAEYCRLARTCGQAHLDLQYMFMLNVSTQCLPYEYERRAVSVHAVLSLLLLLHSISVLLIFITTSITASLCTLLCTFITNHFHNHYYAALLLSVVHEAYSYYQYYHHYHSYNFCYYYDYLSLPLPLLLVLLPRLLSTITITTTR